MTTTTIVTTDACSRVVLPGGQQRSAGIVTEEGIRVVTSVPGRHPYRVFWSRDGGGQARIEAANGSRSGQASGELTHDS